MVVRVGDKAPSFTLPATGGRTISLEDFRGRKLILYFYPKDDTSGCTMEAQDFQARLKEFHAAGTEVIGVSADSVASHDKFCGKHDLAFPLASDESKSTLETFGVWVEKSMYGRRYMGIERTTILIDQEGRVARIWPKVKVPGHADEVLATARSL
jgi:peroxiredoxin Q/BCP